MDDVFEVCEVSDDKVIIKVNTDDLLAIARHIGLDANAAYITVTRGKDHVLSVIKKDGTSYSFDWGESGYTLISNRLEALRLDVIDFIHENGGAARRGVATATRACPRGAPPCSACLSSSGNRAAARRSARGTFRPNPR